MSIVKGLAGIEVDETSVSDIDGAAGQLRYRGYPLEALIDLPFADVAALVLYGELPNASASQTFANALRDSHIDAQLADALLAIGARASHPMVALQTATPLLLDAPAPGAEAGAALIADGVRLAARLPNALAILRAGARGEHAPPAVPAIADYGTRVLTQLTGRTPTADAARAFEQMQILQLDHGFNAGTFTARVVASTLAPVAACVAAAFGALSGRLHGGADQAAIEMARRILTPERAAAEVAALTARGDKIMGMGHREYRVIDPRAIVTQAVAERLTQPGRGREEFEVLKAIAAVCASALGGRSKPVLPNLEFYKGVVYLAVGLTPDQFTTAFALARVFGYVAHIAESRIDNRIMRPAARYVGQPLRVPCR